ncbi:MAG: hypothetical protein J6A69_06600 [Clostridia bacterium]|nr:hypothetical protein [Clostridia bacterium]
MDFNKDTLLEVIEDICKIIIESENPDGSLKIDAKMAMVALDFARTQIKKSISK